MAVHVKELLCIDKLCDAIVLAGQTGLKRDVKRIATIEKPCVDHIQYSYEVARPGDLYLSKLYVFQNEKEKFYKELEFMKDTVSCGLIIHKEALDFMDEKAVEFANQWSIPIIAIDNNLGFAELTYKIIDLIIQDKIASVNEKTIQRLLKNRTEPGEVRESFLHMQPGLKENVQAIYVLAEEKISPGIFEVTEKELVLPLFGGILYLLTSECADRKRTPLSVEKFMEKVKSSVSGYCIGKSQMYNGLENCKEAIWEAISANSYGNFLKSSCCDYSQMGEYGLLMGLKDMGQLRRYRDKVYRPLELYDEEKHLDLITVLELFVKSEGNYRWIADTLFIHETTVRYRLNKIRQILGIQNWLAFYADARTAVYANWILGHPTLKNIL